jgi:hypothetical protein
MGATLSSWKIALSAFLTVLVTDNTDGFVNLQSCLLCLVQSNYGFKRGDYASA